MILPDKINILGMPVKVEYVDFNEKIQCNSNSGNCKMYKQRIQIDTQSERQYQEHALLHEVIHLIEFIQGIHLEEDDVKRLATGLYQVLNDNGFFKDESKDDE